MPRHTFLVLLSFVAFTSLGLPDGVLGVSWPSIRDTFSVRLDALGLVVAVFTAGYLASSTLSGAILRILPIGSVLALSTAAASAALIGFALTPWWPLLLGLSFLAGLGGGAIDVGLNAYGATHFSPRTLNWLHAFFGLGTTIGPLIATAAIDGGIGWRWGYAFVGTAQAALAVTFFLTRNRWTATPGRGGAKPAAVAPAPARETLSRPAVWLGIVLFFVYTGVEIATAQWSYSLLTLGRGVPEGTAGLFVSLYWGSLMAGRILFGAIANRVPLAQALRLCMVGCVAGSLLFWLDPARWLSVAGLMMMGFFLAPVFASLISLTPSRVGAAHAAAAIGFQIAAAALGGAALTGGIGVLAGWLGLHVIGAALVLSAIVLLLLYETTLRVRS